MAKMSAFFYIVVPIYNVQNYLRECLESVQNQTYGAFCAVLIDDGSTDLSAKIAREFCQNDSRFTLISQENRGLSEARNAGLDFIARDLGYLANSRNERERERERILARI